MALPTRAALLIAAACLFACADPPEFEGTYEERTPLAEGRDYAYKLDLFRFGDQVGGVVRFYQIRGADAAYLNTLSEPYFAESTCAYFGDVPLVGDTVVFSLLDGPGGETYTFRLSSLDPANIDASVIRSTDGTANVEETFTMDRVDTTANSECSPASGTYQLVADLPNVTSAEAPRLTLAVVFSGYDRPGDTPVIRRVEASSEPVDTTLDGAYARTQTVSFPAQPPAEGLSDPDDGLQYGVAYLVLYNDGDGDGTLSFNVVADEVLALSPARVVIYLSGAASRLNAGVLDVFGGDTPAVGYGLYEVERDVSGENAVITSASPLRDDAHFILSRLDANNPRTFPILVPP